MDGITHAIAYSLFQVDLHAARHVLGAHARMLDLREVDPDLHTEHQPYKLPRPSNVPWGWSATRTRGSWRGSFPW